MDPKLKNAKGLYLQGIRDGDPHSAIDRFTGENYRQHSTSVPDGKEGFIEFFENFLKRNPHRDIQIKRSFVDGDHVFLHVFQDLNHGSAQWVTADIFKTDRNDKLVEHWDVISPYHDSNTSGHSNIDGPTEVKDLDKTDSNKGIIRNLLRDAYMEEGDPANIPLYISETQFIQHAPDMQDGLDSFMSHYGDRSRPRTYLEVVLMVGQGNFVATLCRAYDHKEEEEWAVVDLFRLENNKVVEHWETSEPVPEAPPNSGKF